MKTLLTLALCLLCLVATAQLPISVRSTNGMLISPTVSGGLTVTGGVSADSLGSTPLNASAISSGTVPAAALTNASFAATLAPTFNGANLTGIASGLQTNYFSTNLIPPGAVYNSSGQYALTGITVGATYFLHVGNLYDWPAGTLNASLRDEYIYYSNATFIGAANTGADAVVIAGSNTFYLVAKTGGPGSSGSNILSRIYLINTNFISGTNTIAGNFNGSFNGVFSTNTVLTLVSNFSLVESNSVGSLYGVNNIVNNNGQGGQTELNLIRTTHSGHGNTVAFITTDPLGYSGFDIEDANQNTYYALAWPANNNYLASSNWPYGTIYGESYDASYSVYEVGNNTVFGGWSTELSKNGQQDFVVFNADAVAAADNYAYLSETNSLFHVRQLDKSVVMSNSIVKGSETVSNNLTIKGITTSPTGNFSALNGGTLTLTNTISDTTASALAVGVPYSTAGLVASVASTMIYTNNTGTSQYYELKGEVEVTTAATTGTLTVTYTYTNLTGSTTYTPLSTVTTGVKGTDAIAPISILVSNGTSVTFTATLVNSVGSATFELSTWLTK